jgi:hypothetical protein
MIDDADDACVDGSLDGIKGKARFLAAHEKHLFADTSTHGVHGYQRTPGGLTIRRQRLDDQKLETDEVIVFPGRNNVADYAGKVHSGFFQVDLIDDADDGGVDRAVLEAGRHAR